MKKIINIIAAALLLLVASSCGRKVTYEYLAYATLESSSYSFDEDVQEVTIPVTIYNPTGAEVQLSVNTVDGKAKEDVDFEIISPISGVLTFASGETTQNIVIGIIEHEGVLTGSKDFTLSIASVTEGFDVGNVNTTKLTIKDLDHPLKEFIGVWSASVTGYSGTKYSWDITVEGDDTDPTYSNLLVSNLCPFSMQYYNLTAANGFNIYDASVNAAKTQMVVEMDQYIGSADGEDLLITGINAPMLNMASAYANIVFVMSGDKQKMEVPNGYGPVGAEGFWEVYPGGIVFIKK